MLIDISGSSLLSRNDTFFRFMHIQTIRQTFELLLKPRKSEPVISLQSYRQSPHYCTSVKQEEARKRKEKKVLFSNSYIEDITRWREAMNFMFSWQEQYLSHSLRSLA